MPLLELDQLCHYGEDYPNYHSDLDFWAEWLGPQFATSAKLWSWHNIFSFSLPANTNCLNFCRSCLTELKDSARSGFSTLAEIVFRSFYYLFISMINVSKFLSRAWESWLCHVSIMVTCVVNTRCYPCSLQFVRIHNN